MTFTPPSRFLKCFLILLVFSASSATAQILHLDSVGCEINETDTSYINKMVRHEGQFYNRIFGTRLNDTAQIKITLYGKSKDYIKALKQHKLTTAGNGVYSPGLNKTFIFKNDAFIHAILRSASNNLLRINYPDAPKWLVEGTSGVMSYIDETGDRKIVYKPMFDYNKQIKDLSWGDGIDFDSVFLDSNPDWTGRSASTMLRPVAYGIVYFLVIQDKDYLTPIIASLKQGHTANEAFADAFGGFDKFKNAFIFYYRYSAKSRLSSGNDTN